MKVKILKARKPTYWYAKYINETFDVEPYKGKNKICAWRISASYEPEAIDENAERNWINCCIESEDCIEVRTKLTRLIRTGDV